MATFGRMIGTLVESGTLAPAQQTSTGTLDVANTNTPYVVYFDTTTTGSGVGADLRTAFESSSVIYNTG